jgi:hypothetical protein
MFSRLDFSSLSFLLAFVALPLANAAETIDLKDAAVILESDDPVVANAARVLVEEIHKRTGLEWPTEKSKTESGVQIVLSVQSEGASEALKAEGYRVAIDPKAPEVSILGADPRGVLFGVGHVLRKSSWGKGSASLPLSAAIETSPEYPIRGHQLGYRDRPNTYDKWDLKQYEQYIRDLAIFGANCIENIPSEGGADSKHQIMSRLEMNTELSKICEKYGIDFWMWIPATFDLTDKDLRAAGLANHDEIYSTSPRVDDVFFPGGDPGDNHPKDVMPYLADVAKILKKYHPNAMLWLSMQGYHGEEIDYVYDWIEKNDPRDWLGGLVAGPGSPPIPETRKRLADHYDLRHYPDINHVVRCQYPVVYWDPAYARTHTREPVHVRPMDQQFIHNYFAPYTVGFLAYSDGSHDDVNKATWSRLGWDSTTGLREILEDYARFFLDSGEAPQLADQLLALERNWHGPIGANGAVPVVRDAWRSFHEKSGAVYPGDNSANWRTQMFAMRATLDAYTRARSLNDNSLEERANRAILTNLDDGSEKAIAEARTILKESDTPPADIAEMREFIVDLCADLWESIGFQTSVEKYGANSGHRGAILDYLDVPLNDRWWLEDEFDKVLALTEESARKARLRELATWENPGKGSFYDDIGNVGLSPHVVFSGGSSAHPMLYMQPNPTMWNHQGGFSRLRQAWHCTLDWPHLLRYEGLDSDARYTLRLSGVGDANPKVGEVLLESTEYGKEEGQIKVFPIPPELTKEGTLEIAFETLEEQGINWRYQSRLSEAWLIRNP